MQQEPTSLTAVYQDGPIPSSKGPKLGQRDRRRYKNRFPVEVRLTERNWPGIARWSKMDRIAKDGLIDHIVRSEKPDIPREFNLVTFNFHGIQRGVGDAGNRAALTDPAQQTIQRRFER